MRGKTKRVLYEILNWTLAIAMIAGVILVIIFKTEILRESKIKTSELLFCLAALICLFLRVPVWIHETGHLLFGLLAGMRPVAVTILCLRVSSEGIKFSAKNGVAGATEMFPKRRGHAWGKFLLFTLGGPLFGFLVGGGLLALFLFQAYRPVSLFCAFLSFQILAESIRAIFPVELPSGKTDGAVLMGLIKGNAEEKIALAVLQAQAILYRGRFSEIPRELLFETPVVREDLPAFHALLFLRMQYLLSVREREKAEEVFSRLESLEEYLGEGLRGLQRYSSFFSGGAFFAGQSPLFGVRELESDLANYAINL